MPTLNYDESVRDIIYDDTDWESEVYGLIDIDTNTEDEELLVW